MKTVKEILGNLKPSKKTVIIGLSALTLTGALGVGAGVYVKANTSQVRVETDSSTAKLSLTDKTNRLSASSLSSADKAKVTAAEKEAATYYNKIADLETQKEKLYTEYFGAIEKKFMAFDTASLWAKFGETDAFSRDDLDDFTDQDANELKSEIASSTALTADEKTKLTKEVDERLSLAKEWQAQASKYQSAVASIKSDIKAQEDKISQVYKKHGVTEQMLEAIYGDDAVESSDAFDRLENKWDHEEDHNHEEDHDHEDKD